MPLSLVRLGSFAAAGSRPLALMAPPTRRPTDPAAADEQTLRAADLPTDGPGLLDLLRKRIAARRPTGGGPRR